MRSANLASACVALLGTVLLGCRGPSGASGPGAETSTSAAPAPPAGTSSVVEATSTAAAPTSGAPGRDEWFGRYVTKFAYAYFDPCDGGSDQGYPWDVPQGLPGYEYCGSGTLWIRVTGTYFRDRHGEHLIVDEVLEGPCAKGSCDGSVPMSQCYDFDFLCQWPGQPCDVVGQDCPEGQKCGPAGSRLDCVPTTPDGAPPGAPCTLDATGLDDCDADGVCIHFGPGGGPGRCEPFCAGDWEDATCADPTRICVGGNDDLRYCVRDCDPVGEPCPEGYHCYYYAYVAGGRHPFVCLPEPAGPFGQVGEPCVAGFACAPGLVCGNDLLGCGEMCCLSYCALDGPPCPLPEQVCVPWSGLPAYPHLGFCQVPPP